MTTTVDEALDVAHSDSDMGNHHTTRSAASMEAVEQTQGPLSAQQAEKLLVKALKAANSFSELMHQILEKKAWIPLGYDTPREMIRERFTGKLCNPHSGQPYNPSAIRRMSNSIWMQWTLSEMTGLSPTELSITTAVVSDIRSGYNGELHQQLVDNILEDVKQHGATTASEVQAIVDAHLLASRETGDVTVPEAPVVEAALGQAREDNNPHHDEAGVEQGEDVDDTHPDDHNTPHPEPRYGNPDPTDTNYHPDDNTNPHVPEGHDNDNDPPPATAEATFNQNTQGSNAPEQTVTMEDALQAARASKAVADNVQTLSGFPQHLHTLLKDMGELATTINTTIAGIRETCTAAQHIANIDDPQELFLTLTDTQLEDLRDTVTQAIDTIPIVEAAGNLVAGLDDVEETWQLEDVINAIDEVPKAAESLEEFLTEIDILYYED